MMWIWIGPMHALALALMWIARARGVWGDEYVVPTDGWARRWMRRHGIAAITLSARCIVWRDADLAMSTRLVSHELAHVAQHARFGPFFLPIYAACSLWSWLRGTGLYEGNALEREARSWEGK